MIVWRVDLQGQSVDALQQSRGSGLRRTCQTRREHFFGVAEASWRLALESMRGWWGACLALARR